MPDPNEEVVYKRELGYAINRRLVAWIRITGEESAQRCAAMLSLIDKAEQAGEPCPGYVELMQGTAPNA